MDPARNKAPGDWFDSPLGARVLRDETALARVALDDVFGFELLQVGAWGAGPHLLAGARTQHTTLVAPEAAAGVTLRAPLATLPFASDTIDAVLLPHTLELEPDPYAVLREAERVLCAEGCLMICGFNPWSGWGARRLFAQYLRRPAFPPGTQRLLSERRLRDWVALLGFDIDRSRRCRHDGRLAFRGLPAQGAQARANDDLAAAEAARAQTRTRRGRGTDDPIGTPTQQPMTAVDIYTDGACRGNPGPGGWAALLIAGETRREVSGAEALTTNNRMELRAAIEGLTALKRRCEVHLYTDSKYVLQGATEWLPSWKARGWRTAAKEPVKNQDLWEKLEAAAAAQDIVWHWVKGHSGNDGNEIVDQLANRAIDQLLTSQ